MNVNDGHHVAAVARVLAGDEEDLDDDLAEVGADVEPSAAASGNEEE